MARVSAPDRLPVRVVARVVAPERVLVRVVARVGVLVLLRDPALGRVVARVALPLAGRLGVETDPLEGVVVLALSRVRVAARSSGRAAGCLVGVLPVTVERLLALELLLLTGLLPLLARVAGWRVAVERPFLVVVARLEGVDGRAWLPLRTAGDVRSLLELDVVAR